MPIPAATGPLAGLFVLDISRSVAGAWCARLLADMGADVLMLEPAAGHPLRKSGVLPSTSRSPLAEYVLANKSSALGDVTTAEGRDALLAVLPTADVLVSSFSARELQKYGLDPLPRHDALIAAHVTPHGLSGPLAALPGNDLTAAAWSGWASINGLDGREPLKPSGWQSSYCAGTAAVAAICAALADRERTGHGVEIDIAEIEVMAAAFAPALLRQQYTGIGPQRPIAHDVTNGPIPVADGHFALTLSRGHFWREAMTLLDLPDLAEDPRWEAQWFRAANKPLYTERVQEAMRGWERSRLFDELALRRVVAGPVLSIAELRENPHLHARDAWVAPGGEGEPTFPGPPFRMSKTALSLRSPAPAPGLNTIPSATTAARKLESDAAAPNRGLPLTGTRGIVLTQAWAGTFCTELLAFLGADVIQVEVRKRLDSWRGSYDTPVPAKLQDRSSARHAWNCNPLYNSVNLNKRCVTLDLQDPSGLDVFRRLVAHADFVAENFSPRVLGNLGLAYQDLAAIKPDVILCSLSAYGHSGPWANVPGIGGTIEPTSGMSALLGYPDGPPLNSGQMYPDAAAGLLGAAAIAAALYHRARSSEGQYIDLSMQEACLSFIGDAALEQAMTGEQPVRRGNHHPTHAPHGIFRALGADAWVAIACENDGQWQALCEVIPGLDNALTAAVRKEREPEIERQLAAWIAQQDRDAAVSLLHSRGVPAAPILAAPELADSRHLRQRGVVVDVAHPEAGQWAQVASPFHFSGRDPLVVRPAPGLGQHNREVFGELLGMSDAEYETLASRGVSGEGPPD